MTARDSHEAFLEKAYQDTYDLLVAVRDYVAEGPGGEEPLEPQQRLQLTYELSRVTRRLTDVMAWLMIRKAVVAGELTDDEARAQSTAPSEFAAQPETETDLAALPLAARGLIDRMRRLEADVRHLETSFQARSGE